MSDKLCHCATRVVASPMEEEEVSPLEYAEDIPRVASSEGAHSSREPSEYFDPKVGTHWGQRGTYPGDTLRIH